MTIPNYLSYNGTPLNPAPPNLPLAPAQYDQAHDNQVLSQLRLYFNQLNNYTQATATPNFGKTTQRPTANQQIGQQFFDTTLGYPIWWNGTKWVNYNGTVV
jgi:hypothetical protein